MRHLAPSLEQALIAQESPRQSRYDDRDKDGDAKADGTVFHTVDEVHSEEGGNLGRLLHDDTDGRQGTHRGIHVVVDDAGIGVHRGFQNI